MQMYEMYVLFPIHPNAADFAFRLPQVLIRGHIFLNSSLTESFGIGLLEAASCGLYVVATRVGGVPEVLPEDMIAFCRPEVASMVAAVGHAIKRVTLRPAQAFQPVEADTNDKHRELEETTQGKQQEQRWDPHAAHARVATFYDWEEVTRRTENVYDAVMRSEAISLWERIVRSVF